MPPRRDRAKRQTRAAPFERAIAALESAARGRQPATIEAALRQPFHTWVHRYFNKRPELWDRFFLVLAGLVGGADADLATSAYHWLKVSLHGVDYPHHAPAVVEPRLRQVLPALRRFVARDPSQLLRIVEDLGSLPESPAISRWLDQLTRRLTERHAADTVAAATILYRVARRPWPEVRGRLFHALHPDGSPLVRAAAAWVVGKVYRDRAGSEPIEPSLATVVEHIRATELQRPGVAGPFLNVFYLGGGLDQIGEAIGCATTDLIWQILAERPTSEPDLLPISVGVDFIAHELFDNPVDLSRLLSLGEIDIVIDSGSHSGVDLAQVCATAIAGSDPAAARAAAYICATIFLEASPAAVAGGHLRAVATGVPGVDGHAMPALGSHPGLVLFHAPAGVDEPAVWAVFDRFLSPSDRGALVQRWPPEDQADRTPHGQWLFAHGAGARLHRDAAGRYDRVLIWWGVPAFIWP